MCKISRLREVEIIIKTTHVFVVFFTTYILYFHFLGHLAELPCVPCHRSTINSMRFSQFLLLLGLEKGRKHFRNLKRELFRMFFLLKYSVQKFKLESKMTNFWRSYNVSWGELGGTVKLMFQMPWCQNHAEIIQGRRSVYRAYFSYLTSFQVV